MVFFATLLSASLEIENGWADLTNFFIYIYNSTAKVFMERKIEKFGNDQNCLFYKNFVRTDCQNLNQANRLHSDEKLIYFLFN